MDFIFYEDLIMVKTKNTEKTGLKLDETVNNAVYEREIMPKAPDCVIETVMKRITELDKEIHDYQDMVSKLKAEYAAHVNFLLGYQALNSPFEQRNLSHGSDDTV